MRARRFAELTGWILAVFGLLLVMPNGTAHAYLDPGSGSFIIQILIAALAGSLLTLRVFWSRIIGFFRKSDESTQETSDASSPEAED